jgi:mannose-6-phosphate isomerase class I
MIHYELPKEKNDRERDGFSAHDIWLPSKAVNVSEICLTRRYPITGYAKNTLSEMVVRILDGEVLLRSEGGEVSLPKGATVFIPPNTRYCWIPSGSVKLYVVSNPPWTPGQHQIVA